MKGAPDAFRGQSGQSTGTALSHAILSVLALTGRGELASLKPQQDGELVLAEVCFMYVDWRYEIHRHLNVSIPVRKNLGLLSLLRLSFHFENVNKVLFGKWSL